MKVLAIINDGETTTTRLNVISFSFQGFFSLLHLPAYQRLLGFWEWSSTGSRWEGHWVFCYQAQWRQVVFEILVSKMGPIQEPRFWFLIWGSSLRVEVPSVFNMAPFACWCSGNVGWWINVGHWGAWRKFKASLPVSMSLLLNPL